MAGLSCARTNLERRGDDTRVPPIPNFVPTSRLPDLLSGDRYIGDIALQHQCVDLQYQPFATVSGL
jgi:hypothetical protein